MYASLSSNKYSKSYLFLATDGPDSQIWALITCTVVLQRKRHVKLLCYCKNENCCKFMCLKKYCIHCTYTCTCNTVWEASWTCPVTVMMITVHCNHLVHQNCTYSVHVTFFGKTDTIDQRFFVKRSRKTVLNGY